MSTLLTNIYAYYAHTKPTETVSTADRFSATSFEASFGNSHRFMDIPL